MRPSALTSVRHRAAPRRLAAFACAGALLAGCGRAVGRTAAAEPPAPAAAARSTAPAPPARAGDAALARAGTWVGRSVQAGQDTAVATWRLVATPDTSDWTVAFLPGSRPLPVRVLAVDGDSVVTEIGPYPSPTRPGVRVVTRTAGRFQGDRFTGTYEARSLGAGDGAVLRGRVEATRAP